MVSVFGLGGTLGGAATVGRLGSDRSKGKNRAGICGSHPSPESGKSVAPGNESGFQPSVIYSGSVPGPMGRAGMMARLWRSFFALGANWVGFVVHDRILRLWETQISEARSGAPTFVLDFRPGHPPSSFVIDFRPHPTRPPQYAGKKRLTCT